MPSGTTETIPGNVQGLRAAVSQLVGIVAPGCVADELRIIGDVVPSGEPEQAALLVPVQRQGLGPGEARPGEVRRLATFQDGGDDVRGETAEPYQLREIVCREPMFLGDRIDGLVTGFSDREASGMGIGHQPDQPFIRNLAIGSLNSRRDQTSLPSGPDQGRGCGQDLRRLIANRSQREFDAVAVDIDPLHQRLDAVRIIHDGLDTDGLSCRSGSHQW